MEFRLPWILTCFVLESLHIEASYGQGPQLYVDSIKGDTVRVQENKTLNLTFWIDVSFCKDPAALFRLEVQTKRSDGTYDDDGRVVRYKNKCEVTFNDSVRCISDDGPAQLYKKVNTSHKEFVWTMSWRDEDSKALITRQKRMKISISTTNFIVSQVNRQLANESGISSTGLNASTRSQDEQVMCQLTLNGSCIQNILLKGVPKSTFDISYLHPNDSKSIIIGCDLFLNSGEFKCMPNYTYNDFENGIPFELSANTCLEKRIFQFKRGHTTTTVECKEEEHFIIGIVRTDTTLSPAGHSDNPSTVAVGVTIGVILTIIIIFVVIGLVMYRKSKKNETYEKINEEKNKNNK